MMFDTPQAFLDFVNENGGPSQLAMITFNNSYTKVYGEGEVFDPDNDFDVTRGIIKFVERDVMKRPYISFRSVEYVEGLTFAPIGEDKDKINYRNFRP